MGQHTSFFVMRFVVFNYYFNRFRFLYKGIIINYNKNRANLH